MSVVVALWNPATRSFKIMPCKERGFEFDEKTVFAAGFGWNDKENDYKFVRIETLGDYAKMEEVFRKVEVFSVNLNVWKEIKVPFSFCATKERCEAIVRGRPYFGAVVENGVDGGGEGVLLAFDPVKEVFERFPMMEFDGGEGSVARFADVRDCLGMILFGPETNKMVEVHTLDEKAGKWSKMFFVGPMAVDVTCFVQCFKSGEIVLQDGEERVFMVDNRTGAVKFLSIDKARGSYKAASYTKSLVYVEGMRQLAERDPSLDTPRIDFLAQLLRELKRKGAI